MALSEDIETVLRRRGHLQVNVVTDDEADAWRKATRDRALSAAFALRSGDESETDPNAAVAEP